jgi:Phosphotransferase enzyme family
VLTRPAGLADETLAGALADGWGIVPDSLAYLPVGFGSHHWKVTGPGGNSWFLTVDDLADRARWPGEPAAAVAGRLRSALAVARAIRDAGAAFAVAPIPASDGEVLWTGRGTGRGTAPGMIGAGYAAALYPYVTGRTRQFSDVLTAAERAEVLKLLVALHGTSGTSVAVGSDDLAFPEGSTLRRILAEAGSRWRSRWVGGPYAEPARSVLAQHADAVERLLARRDQLAAQARDRPDRMVLTHGEPHPGNLIEAGDQWLLVDWDTALLAPPERDLWLLDPGDGSIAAAYVQATGREILSSMLELYRLTWKLSDIAIAAARFRGDHGDTAEDRVEWSTLSVVVDQCASGLSSGSPGQAQRLFRDALGEQPGDKTRQPDREDHLGGFA